MFLHISMRFSFCCCQTRIVMPSKRRDLYWWHSFHGDLRILGKNIEITPIPPLLKLIHPVRFPNVQIPNFLPDISKSIPPPQNTSSCVPMSILPPNYAGRSGPGGVHFNCEVVSPGLIHKLSLRLTI